MPQTTARRRSRMIAAHVRTRLLQPDDTSFHSCSGCYRTNFGRTLPVSLGPGVFFAYFPVAQLGFVDPSIPAGRIPAETDRRGSIPRSTGRLYARAFNTACSRCIRYNRKRTLHLLVGSGAAGSIAEPAPVLRRRQPRPHGPLSRPLFEQQQSCLVKSSIYFFVHATLYTLVTVTLGICKSLFSLCFQVLVLHSVYLHVYAGPLL